MKHVIYPEATVTVTASSADADYPVTNLTDNNYRKKVWKAASGVQTATLRCAIASTAEVVTLHNTNAETAIVTVTLDSAEVELTDGQPAVDEGGGLVGIPAGGHGLSQDDVILIYGTDNYDGVYTLPSQAAGDANEFIITAIYAAETFSNTDTVCEVIKTTTHTVDEDRIWEKYTSQGAAHTATIVLTAGTGETVEAGIVRTGPMVTLANARYDLNKRPRSFSIKKELRNGASYTKSGEVVRTISYSMLMTHAKAEDLYDIFEAIDPDPLAFLISDEASDDNLWCFYGAFDGEPIINYAHLEHSRVAVTFLEAV